MHTDGQRARAHKAISAKTRMSSVFVGEQQAQECGICIL